MLRRISDPEPACVEAGTKAIVGRDLNGHRVTQDEALAMAHAVLMCSEGAAVRERIRRLPITIIEGENYIKVTDILAALKSRTPS